MARVRFGAETYDVSDDLLEDFFDSVVVQEEDLVEYLSGLVADKRLALQNYIAFRLAEVDPGYVPTDS